MSHETPLPSTLEPKIVPLAVLADMDLTTFNSYVFANYVYDVFRQQGVPDESIQALRDYETSQRGMAFGYIDFLQAAVNGDEKLDIAGLEAFGSIELDDVASLVLDANRDETGRLRPEFVRAVMVEGALGLFASAQETDTPIYIVTSGKPKTQAMKLTVQAAILEQELAMQVPSLTIDHESKSDMVANVWQWVDGRCVIDSSLVGNDDQPIHASEVWMIDDKEKNLQAVTDHAVRTFLVGKGGAAGEAAHDQKIWTLSAISAELRAASAARSIDI